jgi:hypothetical protein
MCKNGLMILYTLMVLVMVSGCAPALPGLSGFGLNNVIDQSEENIPESTHIEGVPAGFSLVYSFDKGAVSPKYHYAYWIVLDVDLKGRIEYRPGYPADSPPQWIEEFPVTATDYVEIYSSLEQAKVFDTVKWSKHPMIPGAPSESLQVTATKKIYSVPNLAGSADEEIEKLASAYKKINALVPEEVMQNLTKKQKTYEENYGNKATWKTAVPN